jgi:hypothetical protein
MSVSFQNDYRQYLFEYRHEGSHWGIEITAASPEDAKERLKAISWANYKGEIAAKIPVPGGRMLNRIWTHLCGRN